MTTLIGITGKAHSGKDTIANFLNHNYGSLVMPFALPMKRAVIDAFGLTTEQVYDVELKEKLIPYWGMSPREIMQKFGTEAMKTVFGEDFWVRRWLLSYEVFRTTDDIVVPDVRFDIEAETIRALGGIIIEVRRGAGLSGEAGRHISERGLTVPPTMVIDNTGSIEELHTKLFNLFGAAR